MPESTVNLKIADTYQKLKDALIEKHSKVLSETPPQQLIVRQGSLWGITPRTAKKNINITLEASGEKTNIKFSSKLASDWKNVTLIGCVLAFVLAAVCVWMAMDLSTFLVNGSPSFWSWLVTVGGTTQFQAGEAFVDLAWTLAVFLSVIIALEAVVYVYARSKIEAFTTEAVGQLS